MSNYTWPYNVLADNRDRIKELEREVAAGIESERSSNETARRIIWDRTAERDRARATAADLEQQLARVVERLTELCDDANRASWDSGKRMFSGDPYPGLVEVSMIRAVLAEVQR